MAAAVSPQSGDLLGSDWYVLYVPPDYTPAQPWPLIVFLHGYGKAGPTAVSSCWTAWRRPSAPGPTGRTIATSWFFSPRVSGMWLPDSDDEDLAMSELADVQAHYAVDTKRIYLTGISSGGTGTWNLAAAYPEQWAAIVPVCGMCNLKDAPRLSHIPCWCFHGGADTVASPENPREMMRRLRAGSDPSLHRVSWT